MRAAIRIYAQCCGRRVYMNQINGGRAKAEKHCWGYRITCPHCLAKTEGYGWHRTRRGLTMWTPNKPWNYRPKRRKFQRPCNGKPVIA